MLSFPQRVRPLTAEFDSLLGSHPGNQKFRLPPGHAQNLELNQIKHEKSLKNYPSFTYLSRIFPCKNSHELHPENIASRKLQVRTSLHRVPDTAQTEGEQPP